MALDAWPVDGAGEHGRRARTPRRKHQLRAPGANPDDDGTPSGERTGQKVPFPIESAESIYCFGEIDVNAKLVTFLAQNEVPLFFYDYYGNYTAALYPRAHLLSGRLKVAQVKHYETVLRRLRVQLRDATDHQARHAQADHRFAGLRKKLIVTAEPPPTCKPSEAAPDEPLRCAFVALVSEDNFQARHLTE